MSGEDVNAGKNGEKLVSTIVRFIPGLIAAIAALVAMRLVGIFGFISDTLQVIVFIVTYIVVAIAVDGAMRTYGKHDR